MPFFSVTWKIENFSMCAHKVGEGFKSPQFTLPKLGNTKFNFLLYPRGNLQTSSENVSCFIERNEDESSEFILFDTNLSVVNFHSKSNSFKNIFTIPPNNNWGFPKLITHKELYNPTNGFLPNDTLTIHLYICPVLDNAKNLESPDPKDMFSNPLHPNYTVEKSFSKDTETKDMLLSHCSFLTRIPIEKKTLNWTITDFNAKKNSKEKTSVVLDSEFQEGIKLQLSCYVKRLSEEKESLRMEILRKGTDSKPTFIKCELSILDGSDAVKNTKKSEHKFEETYKPWCFSVIDQLSSSENYVIDDSLKLECDFVISYKPQQVDQFVRSNKSSDQSKEIQKMVEYEETSDISLECKNEKKFHAHKFLLFSKSPVFRAMFSSDTREKQSGVIRMADTDTDTVRHLRDYLYSDSLPDVDIADLLKLYEVADMYQMEKLKEKCSDFLKVNMDLENVCEILSKADMLHDRELKVYATSYVIAEMDFDSDMWKAFMTENTPLAAETMREFCVKKQNSDI